MDDLRVAVDDLRSDMARHQREVVGTDVTDSRNHSMAADLVQRIEREHAEAPEWPIATDAPEPIPTSLAGIEDRDGKHGAYTLDKGRRDDIKVRQANEAEHWFLAHAGPRINLLLSKPETGPLGSPSWRQRMLAVLELHSRIPGLRALGLMDAVVDLERRFMFELVELLECSVPVFGDWKADRERKVFVG